MSQEFIKIKGARVHNLKNINLELPKNKLIVFTGVSGSGKSSLAFDTIFAEGQRRYVESLSPYARQFLGQMDRPDVDEIEGLSPAIAINQKAHGHNPRSIVATVTEIYDYLRVLYARIGKVYCPKCSGPIQKLSPQEIVDLIIERAKNLKANCVTVLSPVVRGRKGEYYQLLYDYLNKGYGEARIDEEFHSLHERVPLSRYKTHTIEIVIDKLMPRDQSRLFEAVESALDYSHGLVTAVFSSTQTNADGPRMSASSQRGSASREIILSSKWTCPKDESVFPEVEPRLFSFNSPYGACEACHGLGREFIYSDDPCPVCEGKRLKPEALSVRVHGKNINEVISKDIENAYKFFVELEEKLNEKEKIISRNILKEIIDRLNFLLEVGLDYLTLDRETSTLSGGESQRIRLSSQVGSKLSGTLYVLDEPTIGLHERDTEKLLRTLKDLKKLGNTVIVVEHDESTIRESDFLVDLGPGAGRLGGEVVASGETKDLLCDTNIRMHANDANNTNNKKNNSLTLDYLKKSKDIEVPKRRTDLREKIKLVGCTANNLKNINVEIPLRKLVCLTGVSGSGKSTLLDLLYKNVHRAVAKINLPLEGVGKVMGSEYVDRLIEINQSPIGRTPRSNPATYTGIFTPIRDFFSMLPEAREKGYRASRFSFNVSGGLPGRQAGRCEACDGAGYNLVEMHFLPSVLVKCDVCHGKRFNRETLEVKYKGKSIADVLNLTVLEANELFQDFPLIADKLKVLKEVGLSYIQLGQSATTLSGGEAQRIKLAKELSRPMTRRALYLLDEPTTGLHYHDIEMLLKVLQRLIDKGNTVIVIEHNLNVIKTADYIIDLGPEGGERGGKLVACGTPEEVAKNDESYTGKYLKKVLN